MALFDKIFPQRSLKKENMELKKDIEALSFFSSMQSIDEKTLRLMDSHSFEKSIKFNDQILIELWEQIPEISTVISKISDRAKAVPWMSYKAKNGDSKSKLQTATNDFMLGKTSSLEISKLRSKEFEPSENPFVRKLLTNPNSLQSWSEMIEQTIFYYYVIGNSYNIALGSVGFVPDEIKVMPSQNMDVELNKSFAENPFRIKEKDQKEIEAYILNNGCGKQIRYEDVEIILHMKAVNLKYSNDEWKKGFSPLASAILASKTLKQEYISRLSLVRDRGTMGMLTGDGKANVPPTADETKHVYERLKKFGLGDGKTNPFVATNASYKWLNMSFNSSELELLDGKKENLKILARKMNVPVDLIMGDSTFSNVKDAGKQIYTSTVIPWLESYKEKLNKLLNIVETNEIVLPVYDNVHELQQDMKAQADIHTNLYNSGLETDEEARIGVSLPPKPKSGKFKD